MFFRASILLTILAAPALAQSDGGVDDAGMIDAGANDAGEADAGVTDAGEPDAGTADAGEPDPCDPRCEVDTLRWCDDGAPSSLDCNALDARCGELSPAWGDDCLLGEGARCDPGYAFGESRCDRGASLYCIGGVCTVASAPEALAPLTPSAGSQGTSDTSTTSDPFACSSCGSGSAAGLFVFAGALRRLRRPRRG